MLTDKGLYFTPLGGSEQFGVNLNVYACDGDLLAVDCGIGFADEYFPGVDLLLPDPAVLEKNADRLTGMIITHAHEDHIGAVAYLWDRLECPLYCTPFTAEILRGKLNERGLKRAKIEVIEPLESLTIGAFTVKFLPVAHSIPDAVSLLVQTKHGNVLHSGDWNLDPAPVVSHKTDAKYFKEAGKKGILAYIGDSTNSDRGGFSGSEADVAKGLSAEIAKCKGKVAVTIFSSNVGRILSIYRAAKECGRDVGVIGRSLNKMVGAAKTLGYLDEAEFISEEDLGYLPDERALMIMTGSQGEYRSALAKVSRGDHPSVSLSKGDTVIFSARAIPGNEKSINAVKNNLCAAGVSVISPRDTERTIHVSGHPCQDEIAQMFQWLKPQAVIPVHGERAQLESHARFAKVCQVPHAVIPNNGSLIRLAPGDVEIIDHVETGLLAVDQKRIIRADHQSLAARRKLQYTGAVHATLVVDDRGVLVAKPKLDTVGLVDKGEEKEQAFIDEMFLEVEEILEDMSLEERADDHFVAEEIRIGLRRYCYHFLGIKPKTTVHVVRV